MKTTKLPRPLESEILHQCMDFLALHKHIFAWRNNSGAFSGEHKGRRRFVRFGIRGMADIIGVVGQHRMFCHSGKMIAIECKRPGEKLSADQEAFRDNVTARGGLYIVAHSVGELQAALRSEGVID